MRTIALTIVLLPVIAMFIDIVFHQRLLKRLRKEASLAHAPYRELHKK